MPALIFLLKNAAISLLTTTAEFLAAAISPVFELGTADTVSGRAQLPASAAAAFISPM